MVAPNFERMTPAIHLDHCSRNGCTRKVEVALIIVALHPPKVFGCCKKHLSEFSSILDAWAAENAGENP